QETTFGIKLADRLRHVYILGKSGTGKSTLLENMAVDDFKKGRGVAFIDPHGDACDNLLNYIPAARINDVIYFNPADREHPIALNILEVKNPEQAELVASGIVSIFHKLYGHSWGPRLEYILRNTLLTLTQIPGSTLPDVVKMLTDLSFRKKIYQQLTTNNQQLIDYWKNEFDRLEEKTRAEQISSILNKVGQFVSSPLIQNVISHPRSTVNLEDVLNSGKILIANLSHGKLGEDNSALLGAMLITKLELAAMSRVDRPKPDRRPFFLYVDEFQNFATESFINILSEARKYGLGLTLANQYIAQIPEPIQKAIFGNAGTVIGFVMGSEDARVMEAEFGAKFTKEALVSLQKYQIAVRITIDSTISQPFLATSLPPLKSTNLNREKVISSSRSRWTKKTSKP
ncbi:type IV secretion system DNA-binding domain-containing protein, partial [Candidatus Amesbacteria bacterium]|nr:type IV secretion system DNA-binding domain-containing protein [Candidatus Amesbacteria bacterium]